MLEKLGIYGLEAVEDYILAGLLTGDPVLLVGNHGCGKTYLVGRIAQALGLNYIAYDASKAMFEDLIGFPNPQSLSKGMVEYVPTPLSVWDKNFILIDEISRAHVSMQNKWLELVRSRKIMGLKAEPLRYVFAAMNPLTYEGTRPLEEALAARFAFIITMPEFNRLSQEQAFKVINNVGEDDAPGLKRLCSGMGAGSQAGGDCDLNQFLDKASKTYQVVNNAMGANLRKYVYILSQMLSKGLDNRIEVDGRRAGMLWRNLMAVIAVKIAKGETRAFADPSGDVSGMILDILKNSFPFDITPSVLQRTWLLGPHNLAMANVKLEIPALEYQVIAADSFKEKFQLLMRAESWNLTRLLINGLMTQMENLLLDNKAGNLEKKIDAYAALIGSLPLVLENPKAYPSEIASRMTLLLEKISRISREIEIVPSVDVVRQLKKTKEELDSLKEDPICEYAGMFYFAYMFGQSDVRDISPADLGRQLKKQLVEFRGKLGKEPQPTAPALQKAS